MEKKSKIEEKRFHLRASHLCRASASSRFSRFCASVVHFQLRNLTRPNRRHLSSFLKRHECTIRRTDVVCTRADNFSVLPLLDHVGAPAGRPSHDMRTIAGRVEQVKELIQDVMARLARDPSDAR